MTEFYIDPHKRRKIVTVWIVVTLCSLHVWATLIVSAALLRENPPADLLSDMFSTTTTGIAITIFILLVDKGSDFVIEKFGIKKSEASAVAPEGLIKADAQPSKEL